MAVWDIINAMQDIIISLYSIPSNKFGRVSGAFSRLLHLWQSQVTSGCLDNKFPFFPATEGSMGWIKRKKSDRSMNRDFVWIVVNCSDFYYTWTFPTIFQCSSAILNFRETWHICISIERNAICMSENSDCCRAKGVDYANRCACHENQFSNQINRQLHFIENRNTIH